MKLSHLNAVVAKLGFTDLESYLKDRYVEKRKAILELAQELDIAPDTVRKLLKQFNVKKPELDIPLRYEDAIRMGPDALAPMLGVSRATAWRWKRIVIARHRAAEEADAARALGVL